MASDSVSRARALGGAAEAVELYRTWAATYDDDVFVRGGFTGTARIAELLVAHLDDRDRPVLDLGCGSGRDAYLLSRLVGEHGRVIGVDMTAEQLQAARVHQQWHAQRYGHTRSNIEFVDGYIEDLAGCGIADASVDVMGTRSGISRSVRYLTCRLVASGAPASR